jgi:NDP-sugar pyrophosphorylase family protein
MDYLANTGVSRIVLCVGYMSEMMAAALGSSYRSMELCYSREGRPLGTGGALRLALPLLQTDPMIVMNGDTYCALDLPGMLAAHHERNAEISIAVTSVSDVSRYGKVSINHRGQIIRFEEKGHHQGSGYINTGVYAINQSVIKSIVAAQAVSLETAVFPELAGSGLYAFETDAAFIDIGIPADYSRAEQFLLDHHTS